jgi:hypothetical protein
MAARLKQAEPGLSIELVDGNVGELTVLLDDRVVAKKWLFFKPSVDKVLAAVKQAHKA